MAGCTYWPCSRNDQNTIQWWLWILIPLAAILAIVVVFVLIFGVIPNLQVNVEDARLDTFEFAATQGGVNTATTTFLSYNISVALTIRNPNGAMAVKHIKTLVAFFIFDDRRLHNLTVVDEGHQLHPGKKEVHLLHATGEVPSFNLGAAVAEEFKKQNATGLFRLEVRLSGEITYQSVVIAKKRKQSMSCQLKLPITPPGPDIVVFHEVSCMPVKDDTVYF